ncbi:hypothetical protein F3Y22_tig00111099pilonHSYRG00056 [Hibiscus syriacus]|uniref:Uncharacterized protein n=1 Tax=Hibiscus syriacus TaxID=106335 RepID=A0A6A2Z2F5_HIBSY|nr:hypothetical protein F3Y22_tig00111099pilonHSYRG00056 [Hibiscus syriacus]
MATTANCPDRHSSKGTRDDGVGFEKNVMVGVGVEKKWGGRIELKVDADPTPSAMDLSENKNVDPPLSVMESNEMSMLIYLLLIELKVDVDPTPSAMDLSENKNVDPPLFVMESNEMSMLIYLIL